MPDHLLEVKDLNVYYGQSHVLQGVNLVVGSEPVALVGRNGMGKTTLCKALMGLLPIASGEVSFDGEKISGRKPYQIASLGVGYVPQGRRIFPSLTVNEHLQMLKGVNQKAQHRWNPSEIYRLFPHLAERRNLGAGSLSGGEQQMLAIGRALLTNPSLLIMDEPSEGLAPLIVDLLLDTLKKLSKEGIALFIVEQKLSVAADLAKHMLIMVGGRIALETKSSALISDENAKRRYLGVDTSAEKV